MTLDDAIVWLRNHDFDSCDCHDGETRTLRSLDWVADQLDILARIDPVMNPTLREHCGFAAELLKMTGINQLGHEFRCSGCAVMRAEQAEAESAALRKALEHTLAHALRFGVDMKDHVVVKAAAEPVRLGSLIGELKAARAAVAGVGKLRQQLESTEASRKALYDVVVALAPHVAVHARNPLVSPDGRADLLRIEPVMLDALARQPKEPL